MALNELQALVEDLSRRIGAPAVLEDHEQRMVVYSAQDGPIDEVRRDSILMRETRPEVKDWFRQFGIVQASSPLRIPSHPELGILGRLCVPVRFRGRLLGFLFLIDDVRRLDGPDVELVERVSRHAGLLLYEDELDRRLWSSVLSHLLTPDLEMRQVAARQLMEQGLASADAPHAAVVVRLANIPVAGAEEVIGEAMLELLRRRVQPGLLQMARPDHGVLLVPAASADDRQVVVTAREASAALARGARCKPHGGDVRVITGIGDPQPQLADAHHSYREALLAARVAAAVPTVDYRLAKAVRLTGADLHDGNDRLALHLGFKLARLNGSYPPAGASRPEATS